MKLAVIGGGSTYSPELIDGIIREHSRLPFEKVTLMDNDEQRLADVGGFVRRMVEVSGVPVEIELTLSLEEALAAADFVVTQIRVGGQQARNKDIRLGMKYGIVGQETTGVGGFAKAMRTIPAILDICRKMKEVAPEGWLINFTNPSGVVTEAVVRYGGVPVIGLCNVPINMQISIAKSLGVPTEELTLDYVGLNHLGWVRKVYHCGQDVTTQAVERYLEVDPTKPANITGKAADPAFVRALGMIPSPYLRYFYRTREVVGEQAQASKTRAEIVMEVEEELFRIYRDPAQHTKPASLSKRGGAYYSKLAVEVMSAIWNDSREIHIVNVSNRGAVDGFVEEAVLELPAVIGAAGARPLAVGKVEPQIAGLMHHVKAYEQLTVEAAVSGSRKLALLALANNPLVGEADLAERLLDEIIELFGLELS